VSVIPNEIDGRQRNQPRLPQPHLPLLLHNDLSSSAQTLVVMDRVRLLAAAFAASLEAVVGSLVLQHLAVAQEVAEASRT
jgi:hypothetical protein